MLIRVCKENIFFVSILIMLVFLDSQYLPGGNIAVLVLLINLIWNVLLYTSGYFVPSGCLLGQDGRRGRLLESVTVYLLFSTARTGTNQQI